MRRSLIALLSAVALPLMVGSAGCAALNHRTVARGYTGPSDGLASYYADRFEGRATASGEIFHSSALTAAHRTLPFGTKVRVTNLNNNKSVTVKINDRGPFVRGRVIDLSPAAARRIDLTATGVAPVKLEVVGARQYANAN
jgi:rare lipoprotein A